MSEKIEVKTDPIEISEREALFNDVPPTTSEVREQVETVVEPEGDTTEETEEAADDAQDTSDSSEKTSEDGGDKPPLDVERITFDEFEKDYTEKKSGVQKRIDKLTAEKYQYATEMDKLRKELDELKAGKAPDTETLQDKPKYSEKDLKRAYEKAVGDGDVDLQWEIQNELAKLRVWEAEQRYFIENRKVSKQQEEEAAIYAGIVENYKFEQDPDLNLKDQTSLICKVTSTLLNDDRTKQYYARMGPARLAAAVADARAYIYELKLKKKLSVKTKKLEKNLQKEKLKTSLSSSGSSKSSGGSKKSDNEDLSDRESQYKRLFGI